MIQSTLEEVKKTMSDSESDSGVGSVRTNDQSSENDSAGEQKKTVTLITPKTTNKTGKFFFSRSTRQKRQFLNQKFYYKKFTE